MADVLPFAGTRYAHKDADFSLGDVLAPPYDEIDPAKQKDLHERSPFNIVRLLAGHETASDDDASNRYVRAAECYRAWKAEGVLSDEQRKCFYVYEQTFHAEDREGPQTRLGFFALVKLQDFRSGKVRSMKLTHESPKKDRLKLLRAIEVNLSPLHMLYSDPDAEVKSVLNEAMKKREPIEDFTTEDGTRHRLWMVYKKDPVLRIHDFMKPRRLYIADGHHRYETALKYRDMKREETGRRDGRQPYDFVLMFLQRAEDEDLISYSDNLILSREVAADADIDIVVEDLEEYFEMEEFKLNMKELAKAAEQVKKMLDPAAGKGGRKKKTGPTEQPRFVMALPNGRSWQLTLREDANLEEMIDDEMMTDDFKKTAPVLLHKFIISRGWIGNPEVELQEDDVLYSRTILGSLDLIKRRKGCAAFFSNPMSKESVIQTAENGELLPFNSVSFTPKVPAGLVLRDLNVGFG
ncbi:MAG: DUF1015 domain-containing protein [Sumerlaeia bacterium]